MKVPGGEPKSGWTCTSTVTTVLAGQRPEGPKGGNRVPEVGTKSQEVGREVLGVRCKV